MTKEEASIKMAELCGKHNLGHSKIAITYEDLEGYAVIWNPETKIDQAREVIMALKKLLGGSLELRHNVSWNCSFLGCGYSFRGYGDTLEQAIFNAVHKWVEAEGEK